MEYSVSQGNYLRMGASVQKNSIIYTFEGEYNQQCSVLLYEKNSEDAIKIPVPAEYGIGSLRSIEITGIDPKKYDYNYEIDGQVVVDPYARRIVGREKWADTARSSHDFAVRSGFPAESFDWQDDKQPQIAKEDMILYKLHIRNFTMDGASDGVKKGTFEAVEHRLPYLKTLGVTSVELMPVYEFEEFVINRTEEVPDYVTWKKEYQESSETAGENGQETEHKPEAVIAKVNCWGYTEGNYFAPKVSYAKSRNAEDSLKHLIKSLHEAEMECIMEMYFPETVNQNRMLDVLRFWVMEYHVDGFHLIGANLPMAAITQDLILSRTKIFYEQFNEQWEERDKVHPHRYVYREEFQYPVRKLLNHHGGNLSEFVDQMRKQSEHMGFVNYIASNNGFTLSDLFSYSEKHNEANGENNADGIDWNYSANYGAEGASRKKYVQRLRERQMRNAITILMMAQGIPMICEGDEIANSKNGNNNTYCQDNKTGWVNWKLKKSQEEYLAYVKKIIAFRKAHPILHPAQPMQMHDYKGVGYPDWSVHTDTAWMSNPNGSAQAVGMLYCGDYAVKEDGTADDMLYVAYNFHTGKQFLALPKLPKGKKWYKVVDTGYENGFLEEEVCIDASQIETAGMTIQILIGK